MNDHRDSKRVERAAREFRPMGSRRRRQRIAVYMREVDTAALDHLPVCDNPGPASASPGPLPRIPGQLRCGVLAHERIQDSILELSQPRTYPLRSRRHYRLSP